MSNYVINKSDPAELPIQVGAKDIDETSFSITLLGQGVGQYGERLNENILHILENFASPTSPNFPTTGQLWYDKSNLDDQGKGILRVYDGTGFASITTIFVGTTAPTTPATGELWYDTSIPQLKIWDGGAWVSVADRYVLKSGDTMTGFLTLSADPINALHATTKQYTDTNSLIVPGGTRTVSDVATFQNTTTFDSTVILTTGTGVLNEGQGSNIAAASTTDIGAATGNYVEVTGSATINSLGTVQSGTRRVVRFTSAGSLLVHSGALLLPNGGADITTEINDIGQFISLGGGSWLCTDYTRATGGTVSGVSDVPTGSITAFGGTSAPSGWLLCDGAAVSRTTFAALRAVIGDAYGIGDGSTTFNVPDLRGRFPLGKDDMGGASANRVTATEADNLGQGTGAEEFTQTTSTLVAHSHTAGFPTVHGAGGSGRDTNTAGNPTGTTGSSNAQNLMNPYQTVNYIIKT